jgi:hypothetical protein
MSGCAVLRRRRWRREVAAVSGKTRGYEGADTADWAQRPINLKKPAHNGGI